MSESGQFGIEFKRQMLKFPRRQQGEFKRQEHYSKIIFENNHNDNLESENIQQETMRTHRTYSEIQNGFKQFKAHQILTLNQLRQEYQILRNLPIGDKKNNNKIIQSIGSSVNDDRSQTSFKSKSVRRDHNNKQIQLLILQKKQLQVVVTNSMKQIQQLLFLQLQYKKQIHNLKLQLQDKSIQDKYQNIIKIMKRNQNDYQDTIESFKRQKIKLNQKICKLEQQISLKNQQLLKQKNKYISLQITYKQCINEKKLFIEKQSPKNDKNVNNQILKRLQNQLDIRQKRYQILLEQLTQSKRQQINKDNNSQNIKQLINGFILLQNQNNQITSKQMFRRIQQLKQQNYNLKNQLRNIHLKIPPQNLKNQQFFQSIQSLIKKIDQSQKSQDSSIKISLQTLKKQIQKLKTINPQYQDKIRQKQQIINQLKKLIQNQNIDKIKFMEDIKQMRNQYQQIFQSNDTLNKKLGVSLQKQRQYKYQINNLKQQIQNLKHTKDDLTNSQVENVNLKLKLSQFDKLCLENQKLQNQIQILKNKYIQKQNHYLQDIKNIKKALDDMQFQKQKQIKNGQLQLNLYKKDHQHQVIRANNQIEQIKNQKLKLIMEMKNQAKIYQDNIHRLNQEKQQIRNSYQLKLQSKYRQIQQVRKKFQERIQFKSLQLDNWRQPYQIKLKEKNDQLQCQRKQFDIVVIGIRQKHQRQLASLMRRLDVLTDANNQFMLRNERYLFIESQAHQLRKNLKHAKSLNQAIDHLWQVKQAQYHNVHQILRHIKGN